MEDNRSGNMTESRQVIRFYVFMEDRHTGFSNWRELNYQHKDTEKSYDTNCHFFSTVCSATVQRIDSVQFICSFTRRHCVSTQKCFQKQRTLEDRHYKCWIACQKYFQIIKFLSQEAVCQGSICLTHEYEMDHLICARTTVKILQLFILSCLTNWISNESGDVIAKYKIFRQKNKTKTKS